MPIKLEITITFGHADWWLEQQGDLTESSEEFLERLEDALHNNELSLEEVRLLLTDYNRRTR